MNEEQTFTLQEAQLELAKSANHRAWDLLDKSPRTPAEDEDLLLAVYASLYHWREIGTPVNDQRGCWMAAKAHISLSQASQAVFWARKCLQVTDEFPQEMQDFDRAYAQEGLARALALAGELDPAKIHHQEAAKLGQKIKDPEDQEIFWNDFQGGDWHQLTDT